MIKFRTKPATPESTPPATTVLGVGANFRGTLMVSGTLHIDGEFEGDILHCERLEVGEHGVMRSDVEVKEAVVEGRVYGNIRALGTLEMKAGARVEGDIAARNLTIEPGVFYSGRCTMLEQGADAEEVDTERSRAREYARE